MKTMSGARHAEGECVCVHVGLHTFLTGMLGVQPSFPFPNPLVKSALQAVNF